ncbi:MAG: hypothetical protein GY869_08015 [Planctomycetes bacterium]|nr:hypothetical protein [Planctomycetota bacterium]
MAKKKNHAQFNMYLYPSRPIDRQIINLLQEASDQKNASPLLRQAIIYYFLNVIKPWLEAGGDISLGMPPFPQGKNAVGNYGAGAATAEINTDAIQTMLREELLTHLGDVRVMLETALQTGDDGGGRDDDDDVISMSAPESF